VGQSYKGAKGTELEISIFDQGIPQNTRDLYENPFTKPHRRNFAISPLEADKDSPEGQILQGYSIRKGMEGKGKDFRGSFLR
jgi:hypothetical protein